MNPSSVEGAAPGLLKSLFPVYRLPRAPNSSVSPSFDSSFVFALFFLLTTFLCSKVEGFPYGRKRFCLS